MSLAIEFRPAHDAPVKPPAPRPVLLVAYPGVQAIDFAGPTEVFAGATRLLAPDGGYELAVGSPDGRAVQLDSGPRLAVDCALGDVTGPVDTLVVLGGWSFERAMECPALISNIRRLAPSARRIASVCAGSFVLGAAGLLDGRRATTHWAACALLQERFPRVTVEPDRIFVHDGRLWTSGGATSGIDLALALVEEDHGPALVRRLARWMVVFLQRPGGGSQFSERHSYSLPVDTPLRALADSIVANPAHDHSLAALSKRAALSQRHLTRLFEQRMGTTPARFVERVRVEAARARLEESSAPLAVIAKQSGFGSVETMRRSFRKVLGVTPAQLRSRFGTTGAPPRELDGIDDPAQEVA